MRLLRIGKNQIHGVLFTACRMDAVPLSLRSKWAAIWELPEILYLARVMGEIS